MSDERPTVDVILDEAVRRTGDDRARYLDETCGDDDALRAEVLSLLAALAGAGAFLDSPSSPRPEAEAPPAAKLGPFRLVRRIGAGGMGTVYEATRVDDSFDQRVAVKVLREELPSEESRRRFHRERAVLARLEHPGIARLIDGGTTDDGRPWLAMELVDGITIDRFCDERRLTIDERLRVFLDVCEAAHYAHRNLVVHRDLKPGNVLVDDDGRVRLVDFGIAGDLDRPEDTLAKQGAMTPRYASPEQVRGESVTTATDVYALGVVLHELLTGRSPYDPDPESGYAHAVCREPPTRPSHALDRPAGDGAATSQEIADARGIDTARLRRRLRGDLDTIVLMALRKEPERRYASVDQFADDIRRHLADRPLAARPESTVERSVRFVRRHRLPVAAGAIAVLALIGGLVVSLALYANVRQAWIAVGQEAKNAEAANEFLSDMLVSAGPWESGRDVTVAEVLDDASREVAEGALADRPLVEASVSDAIGRAFLQLGRWDDAQPHLERAIARRSEELGPRHRLTLSSRVNHLSCLAVRRDLERADPLSVALVEDAAAGLGPDHPVTLDALQVRGSIMQFDGRIDEATAVCREVLARKRRSLGERDPQTALAMSILGELLVELDRRNEARALIEGSLEIRRNVLGDDHPDTISSMHKLANMDHDANRLDDAIARYRDILERSERVLGEAHAQTFAAFNDYAKALQDSGELAKARDMFVELVERRRTIHGAHHTGTMVALNNLAAVLLDLGDHAEAANRYEELLDIADATLPEGHWYRYAFMLNYGKSLVALERYEEAREVLTASHDGFEAAFGAEHARTKQAAERLAELEAEVRGQ